MATLELGTKRLLISVVKKDRTVGHPVYVEKSVLKQLWEDYFWPLFLISIGIAMGVIFE